MRTHDGIHWKSIIDEVLLDPLVSYARAVPEKVQTVYLTGSYTRGTWNPHRPNVNLYFIAQSARSWDVRSDLGLMFAEIRGDARSRGVELLVDCHPFTISQRDDDSRTRPLLTLTTKVFDELHAPERYLVSPTIGYGWWAGHRVLVGDPSRLDVFSSPPPRDFAWFQGAYLALSNYRHMLDHLPWAIDVIRHTDQFVEETSRYAEEAIKDGIHFGCTDGEIASAFNVSLLHEWATNAVDFYAERYGPAGPRAIESVVRLKSEVLRGDSSPQLALELWAEAIEVWKTVWAGFQRLVASSLPADQARQLSSVVSWM